MRLNKTELQKTRKPYGCIARTVSAVSEQAPKTDVGTGLWICSICAQSYGETLVIGKSPMVEMATWWRTCIIYVYLARSVMYTSQSSFGRNSTTSLCLVEWLATWTIKKGTRFRCHLSKALCTRMMSTSSQNEFAPVQWLKRGWKTHLWKMWLRRKGEKMTQCRGRHSRRKPPRWRSSKSFPGTQDEKYARQAANVDGIREPTFFRWHALLLLVVEILRHPGKLWIPAEGGVGYGLKEGMDTLVENDTWYLVDCSKNVKVINNLWVLRRKLKAGGLTASWSDACTVSSQPVVLELVVFIPYEETENGS